MSPAQKLLERLDGVRSSGDGWIARCPAHDDKTPSLKVDETKEGAALIFCFGGCDASEIMEAVGLTLADLYEKPLDHHRGPSRPRWNYRDLLLLLRREADVILIASSDLEAGRSLSARDLERIRQARGQIGHILEVVDGSG